ncbi:MAG: hypothetical protein GXO60_00545 [Epsilonproteobacteria bacterium]|nr:hypothetical protein [Campylobacterota bacterium]
MKKLTILILFIFIGCGYRPSSHFVPQTIGERVYTEVDVSLSDPQNAVLIKDALQKALYSRIKTVVTTKDRADSTIKVSYKSIKFIPLQYDRNGYVVYYQAHISLKFEFIKGDKRDERVIVGRYEFPIRPSAIISTSLRFEAIQKGSMRALDEFLAYLETKGSISH